MKINRIYIKDFAGSKYVDIKTEKNITLIQGMNSQGKSWTFRALKSCILGSVDGLMKKDYDLISKKGSCAIQYDNNEKLSISIPSGKSISLNNEYAKYCIEGEKFSELSVKEKNSFIYILINMENFEESFVQELIDNEIDSRSIDGIELCIKEKLSNLRSSWKFLSSSDYGRKKAIDIIGEEEKDIIDVDILKNENENLLENLNNLYEEKGKLTQEIPKEKIKELEVQALKIEETETEIEKLSFEKNELTEKYKSIIIELKPYNEFFELNINSLTCPSCGGNGIYIKNGSLVHFENIEKMDINIKNELDELLLSVKKLGEEKNRELQIKKSMLNNFIASKNVVELYKSKLCSPAEDFDKIENEIIITKKYIEENKKLINYHNAKEKIKQLNEIHNKIEKLSNFMEKINDVIIPNLSRKSIELFMDKLIKIRNIFISNESIIPEISYDNCFKFNGFPYFMISESDKWKVNIIFSIAISLISGLEFIFVERFDILIPKQRMPFLKSLNECGLKNSICFISVNEKSKSIPEYIDLYYIEDGVIS